MSSAFPAPAARNGMPRRPMAQVRRGSSLVGDAAAATSAFERCIERLEDVVDQETTALKSRAPAALREFNNRKSQGLLELSRSLRYFQVAPPTNAVLERLAGLREKLDINQAVLKLHLDAVREVSTIMSDAIRDAESDGTYSPSVRGVVNSYD